MSVQRDEEESRFTTVLQKSYRRDESAPGMDETRLSDSHSKLFGSDTCYHNQSTVGVVGTHDFRAGKKPLPFSRRLQRTPCEFGTAPLSKEDANINSPVPAHKRLRRMQLAPQEIFVQCYCCHTWRFLGFVDLATVPTKWKCEYGSEVCFTGEDAVQPSQLTSEHFIEPMVNHGSMVWAREASNRSWWPALVDFCPDTEMYYWMNTEDTIVPDYYHVVYLDPHKVTRSWILAKNIMPMSNLNSPPKGHPPPQHREFDYKQCKEMSKKCFALSPLERLRRFSFLVLFNGKWGIYKDDCSTVGHRVVQKTERNKRRAPASNFSHKWKRVSQYNNTLWEEIDTADENTSVTLRSDEADNEEITKLDCTRISSDDRKPFSQSNSLHWEELDDVEGNHSDTLHSDEAADISRKTENSSDIDYDAFRNEYSSTNMTSDSFLQDFLNPPPILGVYLYYLALCNVNQPWTVAGLAEFLQEEFFYFKTKSKLARKIIKKAAETTGMEISPSEAIVVRERKDVDQFDGDAVCQELLSNDFEIKRRMRYPYKLETMAKRCRKLAYVISSATEEEANPKENQEDTEKLIELLLEDSDDAYESISQEELTSASEGDGEKYDYEEEKFELILQYSDEDENIA